MENTMFDGYKHHLCGVRNTIPMVNHHRVVGVSVVFQRSLQLPAAAVEAESAPQRFQLWSPAPATDFWSSWKFPWKNMGEPVWIYRGGGFSWQCVKTNSTPGEHQNSWDLWMFIPLKMVLIGIDP